MPFATVLSLDQYPVLQQHAQWLDLRFAVGSSADRCVVRVRGGELSVATGSAADADFTIAAAADAWAEFAARVPRPGFQDVVAMIECGHAQLTGNALPLFQNLFLVKALIAALFGKEPA